MDESSTTSRYMCPAQELLSEFCSIGTQQNQSMIKKKNAISSSSSSSSLHGLSILELQNRNTTLVGMLEELDTRFKRYRDQLKAVESSYESVAGVGSANVYTTLASNDMSRRFRCLRDSLVAEIKATRKAMGQKDVTLTSQGTTEGETPRLRISDQMKSHSRGGRKPLHAHSVSVLRTWLFEHFLHPYPSERDQHILAHQSGATRCQVQKWFNNARETLWRPLVEQMYQEEIKEQEEKEMGSSSKTTDHQTRS